jgi:hypothetical protein
METMNLEELQKIREAIRDGEEIAKRIADLVKTLKSFVESEAPSKSAEPPEFLPEEPDTRGNEPEKIVANELKGY